MGSTFPADKLREAIWSGLYQGACEFLYYFWPYLMVGIGLHVARYYLLSSRRRPK